MNLSSTASRLLDLLRWFSDRCQQICPRQKIIKNYLKCTLRTVQRALRELRENGYVRVTRRYRRSNLYVVLPQQQLCFAFLPVEESVKASGNPRYEVENVVITRNVVCFHSPELIERNESKSTVAGGSVENEKPRQPFSFERKVVNPSMTMTLGEAREICRAATPLEPDDFIERSARILIGEMPERELLHPELREVRPVDARQVTGNLSLGDSSQDQLSRRPPCSASSGVENSSEGVSGDSRGFKDALRGLAEKKRLG